MYYIFLGSDYLLSFIESSLISVVFFNGKRMGGRFSFLPNMQ